jgi:hypothetical protein
VNQISGAEGCAIGEDQFLGMFRTCRAAFRLEHQRDPLPEEQNAFTCYQVGNPLLPSQWQPWGDWLKFTRHLGGKIIRVRLVDEPPTPYQQWAMWATPYHRDAGDDIRYMRRRLAENLGIVATNWWLFDAEHLVTMDGTSKMLVTDAEVLIIHRAWRDLALSQAATGQVVA